MERVKVNKTTALAFKAVVALCISLFFQHVFHFRKKILIQKFTETIITIIT